MENLDIQKPCVVQTPQGFSVSYKNHLLYSKYNPSKSILQTIEKLELLSGSIIICKSPVLDYGLKELDQKLPENCLLIICEADQNLYQFEKENLNLSELKANYIFPSPENLKALPLKLYESTRKNNYKRTIGINFSAGIQFHEDFYKNLEKACVDSVMTFWKNRVTLTKFGRKYSSNLFSNLKVMGQSQPINTYLKSITKPIIVFGAGQSLDLFFKNTDIDFSKYYILCVDTALRPLLKRGIKPNGVFIEEAQTIITRSFINKMDNIHIFAGLSSTRLLSHFIKPRQISYFMTQYTQASFLDNLYMNFPQLVQNPPFGSVGLTAVYYALLFRSSTKLPVYVVGLDFSYSAGLTHAKASMAHLQRLIQSNRLTSIENHAASFSTSSIKFSDKNGQIFFTSPSLKSYAETFNNYFYNSQNLFDASLCGIPLGIERKLPNPQDRTVFNDVKNDDEDSSKDTNSNFDKETQNKLSSYLENEKKQLKRLLDLLEGKIILDKKDLEKEILKIVNQREYLYLHFPDGYKFTYNQSFLNRIKSETQAFLKYL